VSIRAVVRACSLGRVLVAATVRGLCAVELGDDDDRLQEQLRRRFPEATLLDGDDPDLAAFADQVVAAIDGAELGATLPLDLMGTLFQQRVWRALGDIPPATTRSYSELARQLQAPGAARAVGAACGKNPIAVLIPCHRVLRDDGSLGGYRWGLRRKQQLLAREAGAARQPAGANERRKRTKGGD
jgi:AraC family transcriptional regulator of adaptative response/methylated-DNA-[protein]-cysteine methyltransferase